MAKAYSLNSQGKTLTSCEKKAGSFIVGTRKLSYVPRFTCRQKRHDSSAFVRHFWFNFFNTIYSSQKEYNSGSRLIFKEAYQPMTNQQKYNMIIE